MDIYSIRPDALKHRPEVDGTCFVAPNAHLIGEVRLRKQASIWFNSILRGDLNAIEIGQSSNIQDGSVLHVTNDHPCLVGKYVTVGHHVNLHGCTVEDECLIGIGAIVLSGAVLGRGSIVASGAVVRENEIVKPFTLMAGIPAKSIKRLPPETCDQNRAMAKKYIHLARLYHERYRPTDFLGKDTQRVRK